MAELSPGQGARIRRVFDQWLPSWQERTARQDPIEPGSSLAADDRSLPLVGPSRLAWMGFVTAVDHLDACRALWVINQQLHLSAFNTLLRSALLGAATCVYLLDDSPGVTRDERRRRASLAGLSEWRDSQRFKASLGPMAAALPMYDPLREADATEAAKARERALEARARTYGATKAEIGRGLVATACVTTAAKVLARTSPVDEASIMVGVSSVWQQGSADAHGRMWQWHTRLAVDGRLRAGEQVLEPRHEDAAMGVQAAALITNEALRLWDLRRQRHRSDHVSRPLSTPTGPGASFFRSDSARARPE